MQYGSTAFILTGDAEAKSESEMLLSSVVSLQADVLKVGHHGSHSSTTEPFLKAVDPSIAVITVGAGNRYGHPRRETLESLAAAGVRVYRTDEHGSIVVTSDGKEINVKTEKAGGATTTTPPPAEEKPEEVLAPSSPGDVYVTRTGTKYHADGCRHLSQSKIPISLEDAKAQGYEPCGVCRPPG